MPPLKKHKWVFRARFRRQAFGWRSQPAIQRIKEAVSEIRAVTRKNPVLGAEGAVIFLEKVSPAIEQVDGSSGAIGSAVNNAIEALVPIIADAPADNTLRGQWLDRLFEALQEDDIPYIETLGDYWGELCATPELASHWADELSSTVRLMWSGRFPPGGHFAGTSACFSALYKAGRYEELLNLLDLKPNTIWPYRMWGARALAEMGKVDEAIEYANDYVRQNGHPHTIAPVCEAILLTAGRVDEAYENHARYANRRSTHLATFRAIAKKYPDKERGDILSDLARSTPGEEGKWFAAAKSVGLYDLAIELAQQSPVDPRTLTRAARDFSESEPEFAVQAGLAALRWISAGYGYEITGLDVRQAYEYTLHAAERAGSAEQTIDQIRKLAAGEAAADRLIARFFGPDLGPE